MGLKVSNIIMEKKQQATKRLTEEFKNLLSNLSVSARALELTKKFATDPEIIIDWDEINEILRDDSKVKGYNLFEYVKTFDDLETVYTDAVAAEYAFSPLRKEMCKVCGKVFYLWQDNLSWFKSKGLSVPKTCQKCRDAKNPNKQPTKNVSKKQHERKEEKKSSSISGATIGDILRAKGEFID